MNYAYKTYTAYDDPVNLTGQEGKGGTPFFIGVDSSAGSVNIVLPTQNPAYIPVGFVYIIKDISGTAATNNISVTAPIAIDATTTITLVSNYASVKLFAREGTPPEVWNVI